MAKVHSMKKTMAFQGYSRWLLHVFDLCQSVFQLRRRITSINNKLGGYSNKKFNLKEEAVYFRFYDFSGCWIQQICLYSVRFF